MQLVDPVDQAIDKLPGGLPLNRFATGSPLVQGMPTGKTENFFNPLRFKEFFHVFCVWSERV